MFSRLLFTCAAMLLSASCCLSPIQPSDIDDSGDNSNPGGGNNNPNAQCPPGAVAQGTMTGLLDGIPFSACALLGTNSSGIVSIAGNDTRVPLTSVGFAFQATGPGTFQIGPLTSVANAIVSQGTATWQAMAGFGSGTITVTTLNATTVIGTYSLTLQPTPNTTATGTKTASGSFNVRF
jgi:hypothetical protein